MWLSASYSLQEMSSEGGSKGGLAISIVCPSTDLNIQNVHSRTLVNDTEILNEWKYTPISLVKIINRAKMPAVPKSLPIKFQSKIF